ncbi:MAG TPA: DegV family protein [Candidatus Humimicrobiaceae bacterium]
MKTAIVTDSSSDIPTELAKQYGIEVIPMYIGYDGFLKKDGVDIFPEEVYSALKENKKVGTSSPSIGDFLEVFNFLLEKKDIDLVCCITLGSRLSGAFNAASVASKKFNDSRINDSRIKVFDSKTSTICLGFIVLQAAQAASHGCSFEEIEEIINGLIVKNRFFALLENFEYVFKGGRGTFFGKIINKALTFTPILTIGKTGKVHLSKFAKNKNSALEEIYKMAVRASMPNSSSKFGIFYGEDINTAKFLEKMLKDNKDIRIDEIITTKITTVISAHTGPGIYGIAVSPGQ